MRRIELVLMSVDRRSTTTLLLIVAVTALVAIVFADSFSSMAKLWQHSDHRHGVLVFPIAAYLLWRTRAEMAREQPQPWIWGAALVVGLVLVCVVARAVGVQLVEHLAVVLLIPATVAALLGVSITRQALFPLLFLVAAVPMGDSLVPFLMRVTADVSAVLLRVVGVPVFREGQLLSLPGGTFEVADVCSGLRYLVSGTMVALLFSYLTYRGALKRTVFVVVAAATFIFANAVRAFVVMLIASATQMRYFAGRDHIYFGWLLFGVIVAVLLWMGARFADHVQLGATREGEPLEHDRMELLPLVLVLALVMLATTARQFESDFDTWTILLPVVVVLFWVLRGNRNPEAVPEDHDVTLWPYRRVGSLGVVFVTGAALLGGHVLLNTTADDATQLGRIELPIVAGCGPPTPWSPSWQPVLAAPGLVALGTYNCRPLPVNVFVARNVDNVQGNELVSSQNHFIPSSWLNYSTTQGQAFQSSDGEIIKVNEIRVDRDSLQSLVWYWYLVDGTPATEVTSVKLLQAYQKILRGRSDSRIYLLETSPSPEPESARQRLAVAARALVGASDHQ
jgi:exosortase A